jgi:methylase of polypeptide subunit release factors
MAKHKSKAVTEFGDFQTPDDLALKATRRLRAIGIKPRYIVEPTCGKGAFVLAAVTVFPSAETVIGVEINREYLELARSRISAAPRGRRVRLVEGNFFKYAWDELLHDAASPWLILGNPPWVTSAELGAIESENLPEKSNFHGRSGIEALTGKSNFDISEWMLLRHLEWLKGHSGAVAMLCKTAVARKILAHAWKHRYPVKAAWMFKIDALSDFGAAVDACFFVIETAPDASTTQCKVFDGLDTEKVSYTIGFNEGLLINDMAAFARRRPLLGPEERYKWRSGIKHDCSKVMELRHAASGYKNGLGEVVHIEDAFLFPMFKSSDIGKGRCRCRGVMLVTQRRVGEDTSCIQDVAPQTWRYLQKHSAILDKRGSSIYRNKPAFAIFGVGGYSFAPWKVAISGFYKELRFACIGPIDDRPPVFDDTIYFLPCWSEAEARFLEKMLNSMPAREFYESMIHWADKRPITVELLRRLSLKKLAILSGEGDQYERFSAALPEHVQQRIPMKNDAASEQIGFKFGTS